MSGPPPGLEKVPSQSRTDFTKRLIETMPQQAPVDFLGTRRLANQAINDKGVAEPVWNGKFGPVDQDSIGLGCRKSYYEQLREDAKSHFKHYPFCLDIQLKASGKKDEDKQ